jgi:hypothetical protein
MPKNSYGLCLKIYDDETIYAIGGQFHDKTSGTGNYRWSECSRQTIQFGLWTDSKAVAEVIGIHISTPPLTSDMKLIIT